MGILTAVATAVGRSMGVILSDQKKRDGEKTNETVVAMAEYQALYDITAGQVSRLRQLEGQIKGNVAELDTKIDIGDGTVARMVNRKAPWVSWDTKSFDTLIKAEPKKYGWLADYRKETPGKKYPTLTPSINSLGK